MTTTTTRERAIHPPAAAGGNPTAQLAHLKAHLEFQRQDHRERARVDWCTTITGEQSHRHITRSLHRKINCKASLEEAINRRQSMTPEQAYRQENEATERELQIVLLAQGLRLRRAGFPSGGDWHRLNRRLAARVLQALRPHFNGSEIQQQLSRYSYRRGEENSLLPQEIRFPQEVQRRLMAHRLLRKVLQEQERSPRRARQAALRTVFACRGCRQLLAPEALLDVASTRQSRGQCPECHATVHQDQDRTVAVSKENLSQLVGHVDVLGRRQSQVVEARAGMAEEMG